MLAFSQSLNMNSLVRAARVQAVLPGAMATQFWGIAGLPVHNLPTGIVTSPEDMVDVALAGLDRGEIVTIPSLPDKAEWDAFETARRVMSGRLLSAVPAARYNIRHPNQAGGLI